ncbi:hypothetical protein EDC40_103652 [Aminobacter aminovorans]|uniref:Uncharacterized protein n=1 Tax=Aminobacter aminovorans TaxID=83263 RepID=A0A380WMJ9_AMIAI|nr:hypothetical protein [Aminobacter aminovorans]TCS28184.1 hypothetical protein EDC40_103652 [Aminobacter aminovorans]SUU89404.1 Uncharacterised protein [Aminobacter aminovorans]
MKVTNTQQGPRGINAVGGAVLIEPGQSVDVEVSEAELKVAEATGWFSFEGKAKTVAKAKAVATSDDSAPKTAGEVLAMVDGNFMAFKSAASKLLGDKTPSKKDEIVAALEELATQP